MADRIMLVEDEMIVAMDLKQRLETLGYEIAAHATSGEEALLNSRKTNPTLILMDIKIRGAMDGIETATRIRETYNIPVIFVTAFSDDATLKRAQQAEAYGYLIKPFEDRELHSSIEIAIYKHKMEKKLRESEERFALAVQASNDGIWDWDMTNGTVYYSPRWKALLGLPEDLNICLLTEWMAHVHPEDIDRLNRTITDHLKGITPTLECEYRILHQDGAYRWMLCRGLALFNAQRKPYRIAGSQSDVTMRKQLEDQLIHRALHDELTCLPNRALFLDRLRLVLNQSYRQEEKIGSVLFLDIDHFKVINDSLGHFSGDELLNAFGRRLQQCVRPGDTVARFGGDEFAILIDGITNTNEATHIAERIRTELLNPFVIQGHEIFISASIGIGFISASYQSVEDLLRDVDIAMYHAKHNGRSRYEVFDPSMHENSINRLQQEMEIRRGINNAEFTLYYQPIYRLNTLELSGFEALIRWQHPVRGMLLPSEFIHIAEKTDLIVKIGEWVILTACKQAQTWQAATGKTLKMAVNLSAVQFNDINIIQTVQKALSESRFNAHLLELELTASVAMQNLQRTREVLEEFQQMGVSISIDDFGSGYSSLDHIRYLPTNTLKIDRSFIQDIKPDNTAIVAAIITMAHKLSLKVLAEGVETEDQLSVLGDIDCDEVQGFYLGKSVPPEMVWEMISYPQEISVDA